MKEHTFLNVCISALTASTTLRASILGCIEESCNALCLSKHCGVMSGVDSYPSQKGCKTLAEAMNNTSVVVATVCSLLRFLGSNLKKRQFFFFLTATTTKRNSHVMSGPGRVEVVSLTLRPSLHCPALQTTLCYISSADTDADSFTLQGGWWRP